MSTSSPSRVHQPDPLRFLLGARLVDLDAHLVGDECLTEQEVSLLRVLHEANGRPVGKESLYREVWGYRTMPRGRALDFAVHRLRKKLGEEGERVLETVRGVGFRLRAGPVPAEPVSAAPGDGAPVSGGQAALRRLRPTTSFVKSPGVLSELAALLDSGARCITLLGPAGIGKTRLASELLAVRGSPVWVADLSDLPVGADPMRRFGMVLGARTASLTVDALADRAAKVGQGVLLVDRCAHVASGVREPLEAILRMSQLVVVCTSRHRLGVSGERLFDVGPLGPREAVRLLVERARAVRRGVRLTEDDTTSARIVEHLGGLPLAIELAASRLRATSPLQLERRLKEDLRVLDPSGQRTLSDAIRWSWSLLSPRLQDALVCLALLDVRFDEVAAGAVLPMDAGTVWDTLEGLVDRSWLQPVDGERGLQYVFLAPLRAWVRERCGDAPATALDGLVELCLSQAEASWPQGLAGTAGLDVLRAATQRAVDQNHPDAGRLASFALQVARRSLTPTTLLAWARRIQQELPAPSGDLSVEMAWAFHQAGDSSAGQVLLDEAASYTDWTSAGRLRQRWLEARLLTNGGDAQGAAVLAEALRTDAKAEGMLSVAGGASSLLVELYIDLGRLGDALAAGRWALGLVERTAHRASESVMGPSMLVRLAPLYLMEGDVELARTMLRDAAMGGARNQCRNEEGGALLNLAMLEATVGASAEARRLLEQLDRGGFCEGRAMMNVQVELARSLAAMADRDIALARRHAVRALHLSRSSGGRRMEAAALGGVLRLDVLAGRSHSPVAEEAVALCRESGLQLLGCMVLGLRAWLAARAGESDAGALADEAVGLADVGGRAEEPVCAFAGAAVAYAAVGRPEDARRCLVEALRLAHEMHYLSGPMGLVEQAREEVRSLS